MSIFAMSLPLLKAPKGWKRARYIYIKGVTERFGFDGRRISQIQTVSQKQSNGDASWDDYMQSSLAILGDSHFLRVYYILIGVGLSALLVSTNRAMREPFYRGTSIRLAPRFFVCVNDKFQHSPFRSYRRKTFSYERTICILSVL